MSKESIKKTLESLDETIIQSMNENHLPGLAVGVVHDGQLIYARGLGFADIDKNIPVTPDTTFRIGSISKTFTAVGVMTLFEQGKLGLDDPINEHLTAYKVLHKDPNAPPVTIRHMLTHTSGVGELRSLLDAFKPVGGLGCKMEEPEISLAEYYGGCLRPELHPGHKWAYSNHAFATLGQLITDVSGMPYEQYMIEHVFEPLGMHHSDYLLSRRVSESLAQGYEWKKNRFAPVPYQRIIIGAAGSIHSSLNEMAKYVSALMNGGANQTGRVLKPETLEIMFSSQLDTDERVWGQGLSFFRFHYGKHLVLFHNGGWPGFVSSMLVAPEEKLAVLAFTNTTPTFTNTTGMAPDQITSKAMHQLLNEPEPATRLPLPGALETPHEWPKLCGFYGPIQGCLTKARIWMSMGGEGEVFVRNNHLAMRSLAGDMSKGIILQRADLKDPYLYHGVMGKNVVPVVFKTTPNGEVSSLEIGSNVLYRRPFQQSLKFRLLAIGGSLAGLLLFLIGRGICCKKAKTCCHK